MSDLKKIKDEFFSKLKGKLNLSEINQIKSDLFGKSGLISSQFKKIASIPEKERKKFASDLNIIKDELQQLINYKINEIQNLEINEKL
jgi:Phenylalanyl-tRNA synthetase alpha subunit